MRSGLQTSVAGSITKPREHREIQPSLFDAARIIAFITVQARVRISE